MTATETIYCVRDDGNNLLAWSTDRDEADQAAAEIDDNGNGRAVRVCEEEYDATRHGESERYVPAAK